MEIPSIVISKIILLVFSSLFVISMSPAYAQHHSGALAPPVDFDGLQVALTTILTPEDFVFPDFESANLSIRFFDSETNQNIPSVTYRVQIFHEDNLVANEYFFDDDGTLDLEVKPTSLCQNEELWKCTKYHGEKHAIAGAYYARGDSLPTIQGPVFDQSGEYNIKVSIVGATNPKTMTTQDILFETFLHLPEKYTFPINTANAQEFPISIKSHNEKISNFNYDESLKKISYEISYDLDEHHHDSSIKQILLLEKDFPYFSQEYDLDVFVEDIEIGTDYFDFEISNPTENIVRIDIPHDELVEIKNKNNSNDNSIKIEIFSGEKIDLNELDFRFENEINAKVSWDSSLTAEEKIPLTFTFFDAYNQPVTDLLFAYAISDSNGKEIWSNTGSSDAYLGILIPHGIFQESVSLTGDEKYQLKIILIGQDSKNFANFFTSVSDFSLNTERVDTEETKAVPSWIKNNAGWWADGIVGDQEFVQSIEFLMSQNIINIPATETKSNGSQEIPSWIKNNAGWWANDLISERDFVKGIEFLISEGIINSN